LSSDFINGVRYLWFGFILSTGTVLLSVWNKMHKPNGLVSTLRELGKDGNKLNSMDVRVKSVVSPNVFSHERCGVGFQQ
jgi:hypothetical protein